MGLVFSSLYQLIFGKKEVRILVLGLDNAGKTTILHRIANKNTNQIIRTMPTIGFNVETITLYNNLTLQVWDLGGQSNIRPYWRCYYPNTDAIIYVIDCADKNRISIVYEEFIKLLNEEELRNVPLLIFANKYDLVVSNNNANGNNNYMDLGVVSEALGLSKIRDRAWHIVKTCATIDINNASSVDSAEYSGGIKEGIDWLVSILTTK